MLAGCKKFPTIFPETKIYKLYSYKSSLLLRPFLSFFSRLSCFSSPESLLSLYMYINNEGDVDVILKYVESRGKKSCTQDHTPMHIHFKVE